MTTYENLIELLDNAVAEFKEVVSNITVTAGNDESLDSYSLNKLIKANARAEAAIRVKKMFYDNTEVDWNAVATQVRKNATDSLKVNNATSFSVASLYSEVLTAIGSYRREV